MPASLWAMAVLMIGSSPVSMTLTTSIPVAMPRKSSTGMVRLGLVVVVMSIMSLE